MIDLKRLFKSYRYKLPVGAWDPLKGFLPSLRRWGLLESLDISSNLVTRIYLNKNTALKLEYLKLEGNPWEYIFVRNADKNKYITSFPNLSSKFESVNF